MLILQIKFYLGICKRIAKFSNIRAEFSLSTKRRNRTVSRGLIVVHTLHESMKRTNVDGFRAAEIAALYRPFDPCIVGSIVLRGNEKRNTKRTTTDRHQPGVVDIDPSLFSLLNMLRQFARAIRVLHPIMVTLRVHMKKNSNEYFLSISPPFILSFHSSNHLSWVKLHITDVLNQ